METKHTASKIAAKTSAVKQALGPYFHGISLSRDDETGDVWVWGPLADAAPEPHDGSRECDLLVEAGIAVEDGTCDGYRTLRVL